MMTERLHKLPLVFALLASMLVVPLSVQADDDDDDRRRDHKSSYKHVHKHGDRIKSHKHVYNHEHKSHGHKHKSRKWRDVEHTHVYKIKHKSKHRGHKHHGHKHDHRKWRSSVHFTPYILIGDYDHIAVLDDLHFKIGIHTGNFDFIFYD